MHDGTQGWQKSCLDATGGVGLAASQVARSRGMKAVGTAGSSSKRSLLRSLSAGAVVNSRDTAFVTDMTQLDICPSAVLNSLTSPGMVAASLATLEPSGQFVEIGKRDIWSVARVAQERPDASYHCVAVDFLPNSVVQTSLQGIAEGLSQGCLQPLPQVLHRMQDVAAAFRQMSQARHAGKIVIQMAQHAQHAQQGQATGWTVITGGLGTLGSLVADWTSSQQQGSLCLLGRSGRFTSSSSSVIKLMQSSSCAEVTLAKADAASQEEVRSVLQQLTTVGQGSRQLQGFVHSGGALADSTLQKQTLQVTFSAVCHKSGKCQKAQALSAALSGKLELCFHQLITQAGIAVLAYICTFLSVIGS